MRLNTAFIITAIFQSVLSIRSGKSHMACKTLQYPNIAHTYRNVAHTYPNIAHTYRNIANTYPDYGILQRFTRHSHTHKKIIYIRTN